MGLKGAFAFLMVLMFSWAPALADSHRTIIDAATANAMHDRGVLFVDVRSKLSFEQGHIPDAVNLDVRANDFVGQFQQTADVDEDIVIYCRGLTCDRSAEAILLVHPLGYDRLFYLKVGLPGWIEAGYPIAK